MPNFQRARLLLALEPVQENAPLPLNSHRRNPQSDPRRSRLQKRRAIYKGLRRRSALKIVAVTVVVAIIDSVGLIRPMRLIGLMDRWLKVAKDVGRIRVDSKELPGK